MCAERKVTVQSEETIGKIDVAESVVALIAFKEAMEVEGVVGTTGGIVDDIASLVRKGDTPKGVKVARDEEGKLMIDVSIIVEYGRDIRQLASSLQVRVMDEVEKMTGSRPKSVNINLVNLHIPSARKKEPSEPEVVFPAEGEPTS
ncbi:MAG TPA: Asp23/Gls24 family envelope stress response protein [bacterium]|mgnify:CR=1 FL=1|nr:Asp23/Gls24 family envelope stress response protein [bacterium]HPO08794.1 Asp23/Gls24 family envelope stress response protein [bacterium]HQO34754.1 Asp23/Gls24 family envelope stress response protein [bacterium]HQQ00704.1 Asp23/Gls24 family envelope stress response protein [bacterium]